MTTHANQPEPQASIEAIRIPLNLIDLGKRLRDPTPEDVRWFQDSIEQRGLLTPISVRPIEGGRYQIIYGAHRFLAARNLSAAGVEGWDTIDAIIVHCDEGEALFREIDENLIRVELSPYDQAEFLFQRALIWEEKYGKAKRGGDRKSKLQRANLNATGQRPDFFKSVAEQTGIDPVTVRRALNRRKKIDLAVWQQIRGTDVTRKAVLLDRLLKHPNQADLIRIANEECDGSIEAALNRKAPRETLAPTVEKIVKLIKAAFALWPEDQRKIFLREIKGLKQ